MNTMILVILSGIVLITGCGSDKSGNESVDTQEVDAEEETPLNIAYPGTPEFDEPNYLFGYNSLEAYEGNDLTDYAGFYSSVTEGEDTYNKTLGEIKDDGRFTFYHFEVIEEDSEANANHVVSGYYLDDDIDIQRKQGWLIPWRYSVHIQSGYVAQSYGELGLAVTDEVLLRPSLNENGKYRFSSLYSGFFERNHIDEVDTLGDSLQLIDGALSYDFDVLLEPAALTDFTDLFGFDSIRSAYLARAHIVEENAERNKLAEAADRPDESRYFYDAHEFQTDFRYTDVIKETEEYNQYTRDNTLLEMEYVFEVKDRQGTIQGLFGYLNHTFYEQDANDRWQEM